MILIKIVCMLHCSKSPHLIDVGYKSTIAALTMLGAIPEHINSMNAVTWTTGISQRTHTKPVAPLPTNNVTIAENDISIKNRNMFCCWTTEKKTNDFLNKEFT